MKALRVFKCRKCGKMVIQLNKAGCPTFCCGEEMEELTANTTDAATEKHVPAVVREGDVLKVTVGTVEHPMLDAHYIEWIAVAEPEGFRLTYLNPGDKPYAEFKGVGEEAEVYEYCNLHGLWKTAA
ncbi:MAG: desulfoferrodoxin Dfx [Solobacterium sp.]|nr:desulfoferrodoxin Dfx [Solobacterium sp.]MBQ6592955.1 desulfoferrodoxin Dfx [Solobacterium sp.]MBR0479081.1 desulfoferrodoxin Dfx [Solobacterium sp.]